jgi:hypothetical protein
VLKTLSTETQNAWIERLFERLAGLYGNEFLGKYKEVSPTKVKETWIELLAPYTANQISRALADCKHMKRAPNAPEFAEMCRQVWSDERDTEHKENVKPLTNEEKARWQQAQAKALSDAEQLTSKPKEKPFYVNGVHVDKYKAWTLALVKREADGEVLEMASTNAWREVLGYDSSTTAKEVMVEVERIRNAA